MPCYPAIVNFIIILMLLAGMTPAHATPVNELSAKADSSAAQHIKKSAAVKNRRTVHVTDSSADGYYHPAPFNQKSSTPAEENNVADNKPQNAAAKNVGTPPKLMPDKLQAKRDAVKNTRSKQRPAMVSTAHKKTAELSFGWPIKGRILKRFSPSRNKGIDIGGKKGQSVKATETGQVVYGGQGLFGFGKLLIVKHNNDYLSAYANTGRLLVKEGQYVDKGQFIAELGDAGIKRTALHFEIRKNGKPVNPFILLPKK